MRSPPETIHLEGGGGSGAQDQLGTAEAAFLPPGRCCLQPGRAGLESGTWRAHGDQRASIPLPMPPPHQGAASCRIAPGKRPYRGSRPPEDKGGTGQPCLAIADVRGGPGAWVRNRPGERPPSGQQASRLWGQQPGLGWGFLIPEAADSVLPAPPSPPVPTCQRPRPVLSPQPGPAFSLPSVSLNLLPFSRAEGKLDRLTW